MKNYTFIDRTKKKTFIKKIQTKKKLCEEIFLLKSFKTIESQERCAKVTSVVLAID